MTDTKDDYDYNGEYTLNSYVYTYKTAKECLRRAQEDAKGSHYLHLACLTFCSFTMEAYLNHLGEMVFAAWKNEERFSIDEKISKLKAYGIIVDKGSFNYQKLKAIYDFRNKIAHGRTKSVEYTAKNIMKIGNLHKSAETKFWGVEIDEKGCERAIKNIEDFVLDLHKQAGGKGNPFYSLGSGSGVGKYELPQ